MCSQKKTTLLDCFFHFLLENHLSPFFITWWGLAVAVFLSPRKDSTPKIHDPSLVNPFVFPIFLGVPVRVFLDKNNI